MILRALVLLSIFPLSSEAKLRNLTEQDYAKQTIAWTYGLIQPVFSECREVPDVSLTCLVTYRQKLCHQFKDPKGKIRRSCVTYVCEQDFMFDYLSDRAQELESYGCEDSSSSTTVGKE